MQASESEIYWQLTYSLVADLRSLLCMHCLLAVLRAQELNEAIRLLDGYLRQVAVRVEDVEDISLGDFLGAQVS